MKIAELQGTYLESEHIQKMLDDGYTTTSKVNINDTYVCVLMEKEESSVAFVFDKHGVMLKVYADNKENTEKRHKDHVDVYLTMILL